MISTEGCNETLRLGSAYAMSDISRQLSLLMNAAKGKQNQDVDNQAVQ